MHGAEVTGERPPAGAVGAEPDLQSGPVVELPRWAGWVLAGGIGLSLLVRWFLLDQMPFIMDELYDTNLGVMVSRGARLYSELPLERMPLLTYVVALTHSDSRGSFEAALAARHLMWFVSALVVAAVGLLASRLLRGVHALVPPALLLGFSNFVTSGVSVRTDLLSTLFSLPALAVLVAGRRARGAVAAAGVSLGLAFCTTQKAAYFVLAFAAGLAVRAWCEEPRVRGAAGRFLRSSAAAGAGFVVPLLLLGAFMAHLGSLRAFLEQTFVYGARVGLVADTYRGSWIHLLETLERNPLAWWLGLSGAAIFVYEGFRPAGGRSLPAPAAALGAHTLVLAALLLQHTAKFPYVFLTIAPGLVLCAGLLGRRLTDAAWLPPRPADWKHVLWSVTAVAGLLVGPYLHHSRAFRPELLGLQQLVMDHVDRLTKPTDHVFDGIGIATTRPKATPWSMTARWFQERRAGARYPVVPYLRLRQPMVMISNYRLDGLTMKERRFIEERFVHDWGNVWVAGIPVALTGEGESARVVDLLSSADYVVLAKDRSRVRIDGRPAGEVERLEAGRHVLAVEGEPQPVGVKLAATAAVPRPPSYPPAHLFPSYSEQ